MGLDIVRKSGGAIDDVSDDEVREGIRLRRWGSEPHPTRDARRHRTTVTPRLRLQRTSSKAPGTPLPSYDSPARNGPPLAT
ncbi:hypothetical protein [Saccharopolyspora hattusasensis]|uniref:hypothetical protein n=1 Tax=Saccharopolyspora hattusasensis TaxID=1128679 RepID=UPI003D97C705